MEFHDVLKHRHAIRKFTDCQIRGGSFANGKQSGKNQAVDLY